MLRGFLENRAAGACLVLSGLAGVGKTTLWEAALEMADGLGYVVLRTLANQAEVELSFAALADLVDGIDADVLARVPPPQREALEVALRRREPTGETPDPYAISAGFLGALREVVEHERLLIAIDDVQWLDRPSAVALSFAARRLPGDRARFLITRRSGHRADLERTLKPAGVKHLDLTALSLGAIGVVLSGHLGLTLTRRVLRQVHEVSQGNPLFALELGRLLMATGIPEIGSELPIPDVADEIFDSRIRGLPDPVRTALLAVALSSAMNQSELSTVVDPLAVEDAMASGLLMVDRSRVRPSHPMLAAAARRHSSARERQALHLQLASAVVDPTLSARHLAIATKKPDHGVANEVAAAAEVAARRGAVHDAEELGAQALRLTPPQAPELADRILALGRYHSRADDMPRVTKLLTERMAELPAGRGRAMAHLLLGEAADVPGNWAQAELALAEGGQDAEVRALALAKKSRLLAQCEVERIDVAETWALEARAAAELVGSEVKDRARTALAAVRLLRGLPIDDLGPPEETASQHRSQPESSIDILLALRLMFRGQIEEARMILAQLLVPVDQQGDLQRVRMLQHQLCELELRAGNVAQAGRWIDALGDDVQWMGSVRARLRAMLAAVAGDPANAKRWAATVLDAKSGHTQGWDRLEVARALGLTALLELDAKRAVEHLWGVWEHTQREHVGEPGAFPVAGDLVEAMVHAGRVEEARDVAARLRATAVELEHPWGLTTAKRCSAAIELCIQFDDDATVTLMEAADEYEALGLHVEAARSSLLLGMFQRRSKKRAAARRSLEKAADQLEQLGCWGWAERARAELARVSGRRSNVKDVTPSEQRVVDLAVRGLSNKEIAAQLFVSVYTVEAHLSHVYTKLGIRSRAQLTRHVE